MPAVPPVCRCEKGYVKDQKKKCVGEFFIFKWVIIQLLNNYPVKLRGLWRDM